MSILAAQAGGYAIVDAEDPTGNGQEAFQVVHLDANGVVDGNSGLFGVKHAGGGVMAVIANAGGPPTGDFFELTDAEQVIDAPAGRSRIVTEVSG